MSKRLSIEKSQFIKFSDLSLNHVYNSPISYQTQTKSVDASIEKTKSIIFISNNLILRMSPKGRKNSQYTQYILVDTRIGFISIKRVYRRVKCVVALTELHQNTNETLHKRRAPVTTAWCVRATLCSLNCGFSATMCFVKSVVQTMICLQVVTGKTVCFTKVVATVYVYCAVVLQYLGYQIVTLE